MNFGHNGTKKNKCCFFWILYFLFFVLGIQLFIDQKKQIRKLKLTLPFSEAHKNVWSFKQIIYD